VYATDQNAQAIPYLLDGGGQASLEPYEFLIYKGWLFPAHTGDALSLPDPRYTSPNGLLFTFIVEDHSSSTLVRTTYTLVNITANATDGITFDFGLWNSALANPTIPSTLVVGPQGPPGAPGTASVLNLTTTVGIGQYRVIAVVNGVVQYADNSLLGHLDMVVGVAANGASAGGTVSIQNGGTLVNAGWAFDTSKPVFLGTSGMLTQTPPSTGFVQVIGVPISATQLLIQMQPPILLAP
jgi:hypothetical protein